MFTPQNSNTIQPVLRYFGEIQTEFESQTHPRMLFLVTYIVSRGAETNAVVTSVVTVVAWQFSCEDWRRLTRLAGAKGCPKNGLPSGND